MGLPAFAMLVGVVASIAGCAVQPQSAPVLGYRCDDGREFSLRISPSTETAEIEIARMRFGLLADPAAGPGEKFSCSVLTLWRQGDMARVEMDGAPQFSNCRLQR